MEINGETIKHLADLSNFSLDESEARSLESDLNGIINYISELDSLDTDNIEPTYQVFEMENVWRDDEIKDQDATREDLLNMSREIEDNQIKVPKVL